MGRGKGRKERRKRGREEERVEGRKVLLAMMTITFTEPEFERSQNYHPNT